MSLEACVFKNKAKVKSGKWQVMNRCMLEMLKMVISFARFQRDGQDVQLCEGALCTEQRVLRANPTESIWKR